MTLTLTLRPADPSDRLAVDALLSSTYAAAATAAAAADAADAADATTTVGEAIWPARANPNPTPIPNPVPNPEP